MEYGDDGVTESIASSGTKSDNGAGKKETDLSSLGMNNKGEVRSASEFKDIFDDTGDSHRPYRCPFCEVRYEDRCIVTECVKAPHFKLPDGTSHRNGCNGEAGSDEITEVRGSSSTPKRTVVGEIEVPEALVTRRKATSVCTYGDEGVGAPPDAAEVLRRRRLVAADKTISSHYTTSLLRPIVHAYRRLRKHAYEKAIAAKLKQGSTEYNTSFGTTLNAYKLSLYKQKLTYGKAFQGNKLSPWGVERIYFGVGQIQADGDYLVIKDVDSWPKQPKSKDLIPFVVKLSRTPAPEAPTSHLNALEALELLATEKKELNWYAYGLPRLQNDEKFELLVDSLDHFYWTN